MPVPPPKEGSFGVAIVCYMSASDEDISRFQGWHMNSVDGLPHGLHVDAASAGYGSLVGTHHFFSHDDCLSRPFYFDFPVDYILVLEWIPAWYSEIESFQINIRQCYDAAGWIEFIVSFL